MADWPFARYHKPSISSLSPEAVPGSSLSAVPASAAWPSANLAIYVPFMLAAPYLVQRLWWANGATVAGNVDCGVYTGDGTQLFHTGATAQATINVVQSVSNGPTLLLPGAYYMALSASSGSATFFRLAPAAARLQAMGLAQQATAEPLPATFTLASMAQTYIPVFGITSSTVI